MSLEYMYALKNINSQEQQRVAVLLGSVRSDRVVPHRMRCTLVSRKLILVEFTLYSLFFLNSPLWFA